ncbi:MAG: hypothetical protein J7K90_09115 [Desulfuromusa sp.]|nr:hypothetical protein [Desulfuromusa sp.]
MNDSEKKGVKSSVDPFFFQAIFEKRRRRGNIIHFPGEKFIVTPREFIEKWK